MHAISLRFPVIMRFLGISAPIIKIFLSALPFQNLKPFFPVLICLSFLISLNFTFLSFLRPLSTLMFLSALLTTTFLVPSVLHLFACFFESARTLRS